MSGATPHIQESRRTAQGGAILEVFLEEVGLEQEPRMLDSERGGGQHTLGRKDMRSKCV